MTIPFFSKARRGDDGPRPTVRAFLPRDAAAIAVGAEEVATALAKAAAAAGQSVEIVRTGSRGMLWLEPLLELEIGGVRHGFGPVEAHEADWLARHGLLSGDLSRLQAHPKYVGVVDKIGYLARQTRLTFARCGVIDPLSLDDYRAHGGYKGLARALSLAPAGIVDELAKSGLRGRGGAGFPTATKWKTVLDAPAEQKYIVCNADEGDSGTFADRMLMEGDPFLLIEGMTIAGLAVRATKGFIYCRSEYPHAIVALRSAIAIARKAGVLGADVAGSGRAFDIDVRTGAGAYVCGEETALLESLEGKRGVVRAKPPLPAHKGLFGQPTAINNVLSLAAAPFILAEGAKAYADYGMGRSRGTMPIQLAGNLKHGGLYETAFGVTLGELVDDIGGGTASGRPVKAVQVGGPLGAYFPRALFDTPFDYEAFAARDGLIGHGGLVVFDDTADMARMARFAFAFCAAESCGKCTPCRIGSTRGRETIDKIVAGADGPGGVDAGLALVADLAQTMKFGSLCALGGFTPYPVMSAIKHFPDDFRRPSPRLHAAE
jgi:formate dehydrogenase iron-sulfur subunit